MLLERLDQFQQAVKHCLCTRHQAPIQLEEGVQEAFSLLSQTKRRGTIYIVGNGGSLAIASHLCVDLLKNLKAPAFALNCSSLLTAAGNDCGYDQTYSLPLETLLKPQDLVIAISSSGKSPNILNASAIALQAQAHLITFSGFLEDNPLRKKGYLNFWIGISDYGIVEMGHFFILRSMVDLWLKNNSNKESFACETHP